MSIEVKEAKKLPLGLTREGTTIKFEGVEVSTEVDGEFIYEGFICEVTSQDAEGRISFKRLAIATKAPEIPPVEDEGETLDRVALLEEAKALGLKFPSNIKTLKLVELIKQAKEKE